MSQALTGKYSKNSFQLFHLQIGKLMKKAGIYSMISQSQQFDFKRGLRLVSVKITKIKIIKTWRKSLLPRFVQLILFMKNIFFIASEHDVLVLKETELEVVTEYIASKSMAKCIRYTMLRPKYFCFFTVTIWLLGWTVNSLIIVLPSLIDVHFFLGAFA